MKIRKHSPQQEYLSWAEQFPLFQPLSAHEEQLLQDDPQSFQQEYSEVRLFPDPFLHSSPRESSLGNLRDVIVVAGSDPSSQKIAATLRDEIDERFGIRLEIVFDSAEPDSDAVSRPAILIGGTQHNVWSRQLMQQIQVPVFDQNFPGEAGWGVTTYHGIQPGLAPRFVIACDPGNAPEASKYFLGNAISNDEVLQLKWVHCVRRGNDLPEHLQCFDTWLRQRRHTLLDSLDAWLKSDHTYPYRDLFTDILLSMREGPITYNSELLDLPVEALYYYQLTGDEEGLQLFREMLWGFWNYLNCSEANIYLSDMDFRLGQICAQWSWVERHPAISPEEKKFVPQLLLAAMRMVHAYYLQNWSTRQRPAGTSHNHQTFKARCLLFGWRYFQQWQLPDAKLWKQDADAVFEALDASRTKYLENANAYERFVPEHLLQWHALTRREISSEFQRALAVFAQREWALTDNFFYRVEYGDCEVSFQKQSPFPVAAWLDGQDTNDETVQQIIALEKETADKYAPILPTAIQSFCPLQRASSGKLDPAMSGWTVIPLEPKLQKQYPLAGAAEQWFDKLAWRSGWQESSSYLAIEGVGNKTVSHSHNATNSIIRANFGGRAWLVGNGYGKRVGVKSASEAFRTRELGPVDHNMLIVRDEQETPIVPPVNVLLIDHGTSPLPYSVTEASGYGGCKWRRHTFVLAEVGVVFIDSLATETAKALPDEYSVEWNVLGEVNPSTLGATIEQSGVKLQFQHFGTARTEWGFNASASWHRVMANNEYPHTSKPLKKCVMKPVTNANSHSQFHFVSGFWLEDEVQQANWNTDALTLQIEMKNALINDSAEYSAPWGNINVDGKSLRVTLQNA
jgi:hypothetical protein